MLKLSELFRGFNYFDLLFNWVSVKRGPDTCGWRMRMGNADAKKKKMRITKKVGGKKREMRMAKKKKQTNL